MVYETLFKKFKKRDHVTAGIIGSGHYGKAVITQSTYNEYLSIPIVADSNLQAAKAGFTNCGIPDEDIVFCDSVARAKSAMESKKKVITDNPMILMELPLDIIIESTGIPEAGAAHAEAMIKNGKHIAMITKETDTVSGPYLKMLADKAGLVYTPVEGDQHGLLMSEVSWARSLGLEILNVGKMRDAEYVYDRDKRHVACVRDLEGEGEQTISEADLKFFDDLPDDRIAEYLEARKKALPNLPHSRGFDVCEDVIAANALNFGPDIPELRFPIVRTREMPKVLCRKESGGIFSRNGVIDTITTLRRPDEAGSGGGVYMIVTSKNDYSRYILNSKGLMFNTKGDASLLYRPYHLCGVETSTSLLCAVMLGFATGYEDFKLRYDMVKRTTKELKKGTVVEDDFSFDYDSLIIPAVKIGAKNPIPAQMAFGNKLTQDVPANTILTFDMVEEPKNSALWRQRKEQETSKVFGS